MIGSYAEKQGASVMINGEPAKVCDWCRGKGETVIWTIFTSAEQTCAKCNGSGFVET